MAILDTSVTGSLVVDRHDEISIGIDLPIRRSDDTTGHGYFASTLTSLKAVKNNVRSLLLTERGERLFQPGLGISLKKLVFEPVNDGLIDMMKTEIADTFDMWMPFINIEKLDVSTISGGDDGELMGNTIKINLTFSMKENPTMYDSVVVEISAEGA